MSRRKSFSRRLAFESEEADNEETERSVRWNVPETKEIESHAPEASKGHSNNVSNNVFITTPQTFKSSTPKRSLTEEQFNHGSNDAISSYYFQDIPYTPFSTRKRRKKSQTPGKKRHPPHNYDDKENHKNSTPSRTEGSFGDGDVASEKSDSLDNTFNLGTKDDISKFIHMSTDPNSSILSTDSRTTSTSAASSEVEDRLMMSDPHELSTSNFVLSTKLRNKINDRTRSLLAEKKKDSVDYASQKEELKQRSLMDEQQASKSAMEQDDETTERIHGLDEILAESDKYENGACVEEKGVFEPDELEETNSLHSEKEDNSVDGTPQTEEKTMSSIPDEQQAFTSPMAQDESTVSLSGLNELLAESETHEGKAHVEEPCASGLDELVAESEQHENDGVTEKSLDSAPSPTDQSEVMIERGTGSSVDRDDDDNEEALNLLSQMESRQALFEHSSLNESRTMNSDMTEESEFGLDSMLADFSPAVKSYEDKALAASDSSSATANRKDGGKDYSTTGEPNAERSEIQESYAESTASENDLANVLGDLIPEKDSKKTSDGTPSESYDDNKSSDLDFTATDLSVLTASGAKKSTLGQRKESIDSLDDGVDIEFNSKCSKQYKKNSTQPGRLSLLPSPTVAETNDKEITRGHTPVTTRPTTNIVAGSVESINKTIGSLCPSPFFTGGKKPRGVSKIRKSTGADLSQMRKLTASLRKGNAEKRQKARAERMSGFGVHQPPPTFGDNTAQMSGRKTSDGKIIASSPTVENIVSTIDKRENKELHESEQSQTIIGRSSNEELLSNEEKSVRQLFPDSPSHVVSDGKMVECETGVLSESKGKRNDIMQTCDSPSSNNMDQSPAIDNSIGNVPSSQRRSSNKLSIFDSPEKEYSILSSHHQNSPESSVDSRTANMLSPARNVRRSHLFKSPIDDPMMDSPARNTRSNKKSHGKESTQLPSSIKAAAPSPAPSPSKNKFDADSNESLFDSPARIARSPSKISSPNNSTLDSPARNTRSRTKSPMKDSLGGFQISSATRDTFSKKISRSEEESNELAENSGGEKTPLHDSSLNVTADTPSPNIFQVFNGLDSNFDSLAESVSGSKRKNIASGQKSLEPDFARCEKKRKDSTPLALFQSPQNQCADESKGQQQQRLGIEAQNDEESTTFSDLSLSKEYPFLFRKSSGQSPKSQSSTSPQQPPQSPAPSEEPSPGHASVSSGGGAADTLSLNNLIDEIQKDIGDKSGKKTLEMGDRSAAGSPVHHSDTANTEDLAGTLRELNQIGGMLDGVGKKSMQSPKSPGCVQTPRASAKKKPRSILNSSQKKNGRPKSALKRSVAFGSPEAAEYNIGSPSVSMTPMHKETVRERFLMPFSGNQREAVIDEGLVEDSSCQTAGSQPGEEFVRMNDGIESSSDPNRLFETEETTELEGDLTRVIAFGSDPNEMGPLDESRIEIMPDIERCEAVPEKAHASQGQLSDNNLSAEFTENLEINMASLVTEKVNNRMGDSTISVPSCDGASDVDAFDSTEGKSVEPEDSVIAREHSLTPDTSANNKDRSTNEDDSSRDKSTSPLLRLEDNINQLLDATHADSCVGTPPNHSLESSFENQSPTGDGSKARGNEITRAGRSSFDGLSPKYNPSSFKRASLLLESAEDHSDMETHTVDINGALGSLEDLVQGYPQQDDNSPTKETVADAADALNDYSDMETHTININGVLGSLEDLVQGDNSPTKETVVDAASAFASDYSEKPHTSLSQSDFLSEPESLKGQLEEKENSQTIQVESDMAEVLCKAVEKSNDDISLSKEDSRPVEMEDALPMLVDSAEENSFSSLPQTEDIDRALAAHAGTSTEYDIDDPIPHQPFSKNDDGSPRGIAARSPKNNDISSPKQSPTRRLSLEKNPSETTALCERLQGRANEGNSQVQTNESCKIGESGFSTTPQLCDGEPREETNHDVDSDKISDIPLKVAASSSYEANNNQQDSCDDKTVSESITKSPVTTVDLKLEEILDEANLVTSPSKSDMFLGTLRIASQGNIQSVKLVSEEVISQICEKIESQTYFVSESVKSRYDTILSENKESIRAIQVELRSKEIGDAPADSLKNQLKKIFEESNISARIHWHDWLSKVAPIFNDQLTKAIIPETESGLKRMLEKLEDCSSQTSVLEKKILKKERKKTFVHGKSLLSKCEADVQKLETQLIEAQKKSEVLHKRQQKIDQISKSNNEAESLKESVGHLCQKADSFYYKLFSAEKIRNWTLVSANASWFKLIFKGIFRETNLQLSFTIDEFSQVRLDAKIDQVPDISSLLSTITPHKRSLHTAASTYLKNKISLLFRYLESLSISSPKKIHKVIQFVELKLTRIEEVANELDHSLRRCKASFLQLNETNPSSHLFTAYFISETKIGGRLQVSILIPDCYPFAPVGVQLHSTNDSFDLGVLKRQLKKVSKPGFNALTRIIDGVESFISSDA